ncbi:hypothetical protein LIER_29578 [Lithospermum erythrorhizon]|uniref:Transposase n=1 Tax=Lithospermum erythrorhizon TaxID=34254 RepID=A0AAV3RKN2_LITER
MEKSSVLLLGWKFEENVSVEQEVVNEVMADIVNEVEVDVVDDVEGAIERDIFLPGLELAIERELPAAEHRLCVRHLQANWSKKYAGKLFKDAMWEAAKAASVPYFEAHLEEIRKMSVDAFDALDKIDKKKWTRCAFRPGSNCPMLVKLG